MPLILKAIGQKTPPALPKHGSKGSRALALGWTNGMQRGRSCRSPVLLIYFTPALPLEGTQLI